jgi:hypothetical protein
MRTSLRGAIVETWVAHVVDAALGDLLRLAERSARADDRGVMLLHPRFPGGHALLFLCAPLRFGKRHPCFHTRARLAAKKNGEICVVHVDSSFLRFAGCATPVRMAGRGLSLLGEISGLEFGSDFDL